MSEPENSQLRRSLSLLQVVLYGLGTTVGAGIYLLMGEVARASGMAAPTAFLAASLLAAFTALSFGELVSRYPQSAGEAVYVREGFGSRNFATAIGLLVAVAGCVSAAAMANGFAGYLAEFVELPEAICVAAFVATLVGVSVWGVAESVSVAGLFTLIEIGGLLAIIAVAGESLEQLPERWTELLPVSDPGVWRGVAMASLLTFYAFLGFEDMVNVAEEVKDVRRTLPLGIGITLAITTVLYITIAAICVLAVPPAELAGSTAPLAFVYERATGSAPTGIALVGILAVVNGALIQIIMASRVLYGLAARGHLPVQFARIHPRTGTPHFATLAAGALVLVLALGFPLARLAEGTSVVTLAVFASVNLALWKIKGRAQVSKPAFGVPRWVPVVGACTTSGLLLLRLGEAVFF
ncbi:MAG: amino acid permease [Deltaproteobacteria bacterium]|nr:amino acid permease [Deltaproteobacteria bacterium]MBW2387269.1 amino acid permease [Deltaproteobacteria bacterium]